MRIRATNVGPDAAPLHLMPTVWFRNTWSWDAIAASQRPLLRLAGKEVVALHPTLGRYRLAARADGAESSWLFTENETTEQVPAAERAEHPRYTKDAFHRSVVDGDASAVNPESIGTKAAFDARWVVPPGHTVELLLAMVADGGLAPQRLLDDADPIFDRRVAEADEFYAALAWPTASPRRAANPASGAGRDPVVAPVLRVRRDPLARRRHRLGRPPATRPVGTRTGVTCGPAGF